MIGADESGRGPWAGPLVVVAVRLHEEISGLDDSKKLTAKRRQQLESQLRSCSDSAIELVSAATIDRIGLRMALKQAYASAIMRLQPKQDEEIIVDGTLNYAERWSNSRALVKADQTIPAVSAASIIAKETRDRYMREAAQSYPEYGFERHVGYGTAAHRQALDVFGVCPEHRLSVKPVKRLL